MKKAINIALVTLSLGLSSVFGQTSLESASTNAQRKLDDALGRLAELRESIGKEKIPLAKERDSVFESLREIRRKADRAQRLSDNQSAWIEQFKLANGCCQCIEQAIQIVNGNAINSMHSSMLQEKQKNVCREEALAQEYPA